MAIRRINADADALGERPGRSRVHARTRLHARDSTPTSTLSIGNNEDGVDDHRHMGGPIPPVLGLVPIVIRSSRACVKG
ncbi:hypothetical protein PBI_PIPEFISH_68 [Mycobacterium phage Pipefish]|uniref:Uncharacterized protein n=1 Tax=Mycobacterium phage Pipefish TaxID=373413 RepID=Q19YT7_9CAUD|nr:gp68 [Mycobacterium phage Pipefish]ABD58565.1 hypothetical protein PBI_PIPEFISH_68 [Mycobacterium phage Pipefish]